MIKSILIRFSFLLFAVIFSVKSFADTTDKHKVRTTVKGVPNGRLKTLLVPGEFHVVKDGVVFDCYSSGNYDITLEDEDGNIMFHGSIAAIEGQSYFIYICGLNPDVDDIFD